MSKWIARELGPDVPLHFTAFHPDYKMTDLPHTPAATLTRSREIALREGLRYVYTGNVHDRTGGTTFCPACAKPVVVRDWHEILRYELTPAGACGHCGAQLPGPVRPLRPAVGPAARPDPGRAVGLRRPSDSRGAARPIEIGGRRAIDS